MHIYDAGQDREALAIRRLFLRPSPILPPYLGVLEDRVWIGAMLPTHRLVDGMAAARPGDIDVVIGPLVVADPRQYEEIRVRYVKSGRPEQHPSWPHWFAWRESVFAGGLSWPPPMPWLIAAEIKVSRVSASGILRRKQTSPSRQDAARGQAAALSRLGFARTYLLRIVAGEASGRFVGNEWFASGDRTSSASSRYEDDVEQQPGDPFNTLVVGVASITGRTEDMAGAVSTGLVALHNPNPLRNQKEALEAQASIQARVAEAMAQAPVPKHLPVVVLACSGSRCGQLYVAAPSAEPWTTRCPRCQGNSTVAATSRH